MLSADTNLFIYAANPASRFHEQALGFLNSCSTGETEFVICELVLVEIYMLLRNPAGMEKPLNAADAAQFCQKLRANPVWQHVDYEPMVSHKLWNWAAATSAGFRKVIDARLALTLQHHGVTRFATANTRDFEEFGFDRLWNPLV